MWNGWKLRAAPGGVGAGVLRGSVLYGNSMRKLASAEGDDAPDRVVRGNPNGYSVAWHHLDAEAAHSAAQLRKHFMSLVALHAVQTAAVNRHDRALHINQIILAQLLSFQSKIVPHELLHPQTLHYRLRTASSTCRAKSA